MRLNTNKLLKNNTSGYSSSFRKQAQDMKTAITSSSSKTLVDVIAIPVWDEKSTPINIRIPIVYDDPEIEDETVNVSRPEGTPPEGRIQTGKEMPIAKPKKKKSSGGFFSDIGNAFEGIPSAISKVGAPILKPFEEIGKGIGSGVEKGVVNITKPIGEGLGDISKGIGSVIKPVGEGLGNLVERVDNVTGKIFDIGDGLLDFLGNPILVIGGLVIGGIIVTKLMK